MRRRDRRAGLTGTPTQSRAGAAMLLIHPRPRMSIRFNRRFSATC
jgi:hypothetical protein